eukprot:NODE_55_length_26219_cov_0.194908.p1 type:complete len:1033 gc:universal NODE_55_length_26219_cov_0.194908:12494-9396(-)
MSVSAATSAKKNKLYKRFAGLVDDRKSKLAKELHHEVFPLKADIFDSEISLVIKDFATDVLAALIQDTSNEKWAVLQFCILVWSDSMGKQDTKIDELIKFSVASKPEDGMPILALAMFSSGTFKSLDLTVDQQVLFTSSALSLIVSAAPHLYHEIQTIRRNELWAHGGQVFTLALGDRFLPSHFCWTRCRNLVQVLLDAVLKHYMPDIVHNLGYSYTSTKSTVPDSRIMEALSTPYMNLFVQQPLPSWLNILKFKLPTIPENLPYKLIWNSAVGICCQVALRHACEVDLKLTVVEPKWGWAVLNKWLVDPSFKLFWNEKIDNDIITICSILKSIKSDVLCQQGVLRVIYFIRGFVQRCLISPTPIDDASWSLIAASAIHVFQCVLSSINEKSIGAFEKLALSETFATCCLIIPLCNDPQSLLLTLNNIQGSLFVDYLIERWSDICYSAFLLNMQPLQVELLGNFNLTNYKVFNESEYFTTTQPIGDPAWCSNWYYPYSLLQNSKNSKGVELVLLDFFARSTTSSTTSAYAKGIICKTIIKMLIRIVYAGWINQTLDIKHKDDLLRKYIFNDLSSFISESTSAPLLQIFDLYYQINPTAFISEISKLDATPSHLVIQAIYSNNKKLLADGLLKSINSDSLVYFNRLGRDVFLFNTADSQTILLLLINKLTTNTQLLQTLQQQETIKASALSTGINKSDKMEKAEKEKLEKELKMQQEKDKEIMNNHINAVCSSLSTLSLFANRNPSLIHEILNHLPIHIDLYPISSAIIDLFYTVVNVSNESTVTTILQMVVQHIHEQYSLLLADRVNELQRTRLVEKMSLFLVDCCCSLNINTTMLLPVLHVFEQLAKLDEQYPTEKIDKAVEKEKPLESKTVLVEKTKAAKTVQAPLKGGMSSANISNNSKANSPLLSSASPFINKHVPSELKQISIICIQTLIHLFNRVELYDQSKEIPSKCISLSNSLLLQSDSTLTLKTIFNNSLFSITCPPLNKIKSRVALVSPQSNTPTKSPTRTRYIRNAEELVIQSLEKYLILI